MRPAIRMWVATLGATAFVAALVAGSAGPAGAKDPASVTISGPGIPLGTPVELSAMTHPDEREGLDTGLWHAMPGEAGPALAPEQPVAYLGPRHTLTWLVPTGPDETTAIRQDLYLYVDGGPLVYTAPGQPIWDGITGGGWYRAPDRLRTVLADACVPLVGEYEPSTTCWERRRAEKAKSAEARMPARGKAAGDAASRDSWWPEAIAVATAVAGLTGISVAAVRRRSRRARGGRVVPSPV
jgi:hypothetical protein